MRAPFLFSVLFISASCFAQGTIPNQDRLYMEENKNQFPSVVKFKTDLEGSRLFLEKNRFTFVKYSLEDLERIHDAKHHKDVKGHSQATAVLSDIVHAHAYQATFVNANPNVILSSEKKSSFYSNYFIGNDPAKWASQVYSYEKVTYTDLYPNIDLVAYSQNKQFKYDFVVQAGTDPSQIRIKYDGADDLQIKNNALVIKTSIGDVVENIPLAYQMINGQQVNVTCAYELTEAGHVSFDFPNGYNKNFTLVIDPVLIAATYSGSSSTTYGHSATYDNGGNIYTGGESFGAGYPTTPGAFDLSFSGGSTDIAIAKLNPNGSALIWATYLGGSSSEIPNSLYVNDLDEIYVYGASNSSNFPTSTGCFDATSNGGYDIVLTHLNATGTALIGSTYVGGSAGDGYVGFISGFLNGHDGMRGEIIVDEFNNAWVASYTASSNFPTSAVTYDASYNGLNDACVMKLSPDLSTLIWSTFLGGTSDDLGYGVKVNAAGEAYVTGYTSSSAFPTTAGSYQPAYQGGTSDGFIAKFNPAGTALTASSYFGTNSNDISYFLYLDKVDVPYIFGATTGLMPVTTGVYSNPSAGNFISKLDTNLTSILVSTTVGTAGSFLEAEAFMVDSCDNIYIAGFGSTAGYPVTTDALYLTQAAASGGNCYLMVLDKDATTLLYGSFYFGWHVDGGTSRFDPAGCVYLGICMGAPAVSTPAWAYDHTGPSWDMFVVKLDFEKTGVNAAALVSPNDTVCLGTAVTFTNNSNGVVYEWDFGDGSAVSTAVTPPAHTYPAVGTYLVTLIAIDSASCNIIDSTSLSVTVLSVPVANAGNDTSTCSSASVQLNASGGTTYSWSPSTGLSNPNIANPIASPTLTTTYVVQISNGICSDFDTITVNASTDAIAAISLSDTVCLGTAINFTNSSNGVNYVWDFGDGSPTSTVVSPSYTYPSTGIYTVTLLAIDSASCNIIDSTSLTATVLAVPSAFAGNDTSFCTGGSVQLNASGGTIYTWTPSTGLSNANIANPVANPSVATTYIVQVSNGACSDYDTIVVSSAGPTAVSSDGTICAGDSVALTSSGGTSFAWTPAAGLSNASVANPTASPGTTTTYTVTVTDGNGCTSSTTSLVVVNPIITSSFYITPEPPYYINGLIIFNDSTTAPNSWFFGDGSSSTLQAPDHTYTEPGFYTICHVLDLGGCVDTVCKTIEVVPFDILIPNVVTTNGDGQNEFLLFQYLEYYPNSRIEIYNRWGLKLYENDDYQNNWEGSKYSDGVYYYILYLNKNGDIRSIPGFFHLLREK